MASGDSLIPNGVIDNFKLSEKATTLLQVVRSTDSDTNPSNPTWGVVSVTLDSVGNKITMTDEAVGNIVIVSATTKNKPYTQTTPKPVISVEPKVIASNRNEVEKSNIANQVAGKICVGNGTNGYESKVLENAEVIDGSIVTVPSSNTIALDNSNSPASKWFKAISQGTNGVVGSVYGMELTVGGDTGSFSQLTNGTTTDWNGGTVRTFVGHIPINAEVK